jgi:predicted transcriptional regulator
LLQGEGSYNNVNSSQKTRKMQSIFLPDLPVFCAKFILDGHQALLTGNRKHFYSYDLNKNKLEKHTVGTLDQKNLSSISVGNDFFSVS